MTDDEDQPDALDNAQVSINDFKEFIARANVKSECERCKSSAWYYLRGDSAENMLAFINEPFEEKSKNQGFTSYMRTCLNCGNIQSFSRAVVTAKINHAKKSEDT